MKIHPILTDKSIDIIVALRGRDGISADAQIVEKALVMYFASIKSQFPINPEGIPVKLTTPADWQPE
jgi:hypothetical protein